MISMILTEEIRERLGDIKIGIYEFLLKCNPTHEVDAYYNTTGNLIDSSTYVMKCKEWDMETLATDLGVGLRESETAWEAIKRYMENEINAEKKETSDKS